MCPNRTNLNRPIIDRFFSANRPIFPPESSDATAGIVRNRTAKRPHRQIVGELNAIEADLSAVALSLPNGAKVEARETDKALQQILKQLGIGA